VLVELERAEDLKEAYPNYFLDMTMFAQHVRAAMASEPLKLPPPKTRGQSPLLPRRAPQRRRDLALALIDVARLLEPAAKLATARHLLAMGARKQVEAVLSYSPGPAATPRLEWWYNRSR
jgi:hypothetical protein